MNDKKISLRPMSVINLKRGNDLISTNSNNVAIEIKASQLEKELITTDRVELKAILKRKVHELDEKAK